MINDYDTAIWADHHARFSGDVHRLFCATWAAFQRLHTRRYAAPWRKAI